jgi:hypothetical protein
MRGCVHAIDPCGEAARGGIFYTARKDLAAGFQLLSRRFFWW